MFKRILIAGLVSFVAISAAVTQAKAAIVTEEFTVDASDFINANTADPVPYNKFTTIFEITFDPSVSYSPTNNGFLLKSASFGFDNNYYGFEYDPTGAQGGGQFFLVGGVSGGSVIGSDNHFDLELNLQNSPFDYVRYITADDSNFFANSISVSVASFSAVPLPAALPLFATAFAALRGAGIRKSRSHKAA